MKVCMNANIIKTQFFHKCHSYAIEKFSDFFILTPSDLITTLTYILMDNFCPCFIILFMNMIKVVRLSHYIHMNFILM